MNYDIEHSEDLSQLIDELSVYISALPLTDEQADELSRRLLEIIDTAEHDAFCQGANCGAKSFYRDKGRD